jgi:hypothetical protein
MPLGEPCRIRSPKSAPRWTDLDAVQAAGAPEDDEVWRAYVALNNAAYDYDRLLGETFDEVTPFDVERITEEGEDAPVSATVVAIPPPSGDDPHPRVVSVRQRRDYRVPSVAALLRAAWDGRAPATDSVADPVGAAVIELLESGDGSLGMLDVPELEPLDGVVVVAEVDTPLTADVMQAGAAESAFRLAPGETVLARLHESTPD